MDTDDISTAVNVIRMNLNGIGFSTHGYDGPFTTAWTIDGHFVADFIDTGTLNADIIKAGVLQDENANTTFNLVTGALKSNNLTIDSTYFKLANDGKITSITSDGRKLEMNKGKITGYKVDGTQSAALEIGDGYFNIIGKLALNGVVGVSGSTSFVKSLTTEEYTIGSMATKTVFEPTSVSLSGGSVSLTGCSTVASTVTASATVWVEGQPQYITFNISLPAISLQGTPSVTQPTATINKSAVVINEFSPSYESGGTVKALKTVSANTGSINSADGLIQSIS